MTPESGCLLMSVDGDPQVVESKDRRKLGQLVKKRQIESRSATLRGKVIHGTFYKQIENLGTGGVSQWLVEGKLSPADEAKLMVVQDGTIKDQEIKHYLYTFFSISYLYLVIGIEIGALEMVFTNKN